MPKLYIKSSEFPQHLQPLGSAVLLNFRSAHYLITAGHCLKQSNEFIKIGVLNENGHLTMIRGAVAIYEGEDNRIDLGFIKLSDASVDVLSKTHKFLHENQLRLTSNLEDVTDYLILGYPNTKTIINHRAKKIGIEPFVYIAKSKSQNFYEKHRYNKSSSILLNFNRRRSSFVTVHEKHMSPDPRGVSGGGLWYVSTYDIPELKDVSFHLCGIMIEHDAQNNFMVATRVEEFVPVLKELQKHNANFRDG